jgi:branched-chain amino acid transport system ATP-binding protein
MLRTDRIVKNFEGLTALDGVSLDVDGGSITGLIGPNGSGKTTLFNVITGYLQPTSGQVLFREENITGKPPHEVLHQGLGRTFQKTEPFENLTVYENMLIAPLKLSGSNRTSRAEQLLEFFDIDHLRDETAGSLSYGQQKLLEFARMLMTDPDLILLDEPASGVNPALLERILDYIRQLNEEGLTFIIIEHNMDFIGKVCDDIVVLANGKIIARGDIEEIQQNEKVRDAYFGG